MAKSKIKKSDSEDKSGDNKKAGSGKSSAAKSRRPRLGTSQADLGTPF